MSSNGVSWQYVALGVAAGVGTGCLLGVLGTRWLRRPAIRAPVRAPPQTSVQTAALVSAIGELVAEMGRLRQALEQGMFYRAPPPPSSMRTVDSLADFVSARGDMESDAEEEFYDPESGAESNSGAEGGGGSGRNLLAELDELGRRTLTSEEVCSSVAEQIRAALVESPGDVELLWRLARALVHKSIHKQQLGDTEEEKDLIEQAFEYSRQALDIDTGSWQVHQWYAIAIGSQAKLAGTQEKIQKGYEYKEHIDQAISINPNEPTLQYLCGRWCFEVAGLSWLERKAATALFAAPPESSYDDALQCFMKAEELKPDQWKANLLFIAKCHLKLGDIPTAVEWLHKALHTPTITAEDENSHTDILELLTQHDADFITD